MVMADNYWNRRSSSRRSFLRAAGVVAGAAALGPVLAACSSNSNNNGNSKATANNAAGNAASSQAAGSPGVGKVGGTFSYATESEPDLINPILTDQPSDYATPILFRGLLRYDQTNKPQPDIAKTFDLSSDQLTHTFHLRDDVKWHDGQPLTADDVKFTLDAIRDKKNNSASFEKFELVKSVDVVDKSTVKIVLSQPFAPLLDKLTQPLAPMHLLAGKDLAKDPFNTKPVGNGPFKLTEWRKGEFMTLEANTAFYTGRPKLDKFIIKFVPDAAARLLQLKNGEVDGAFLEPKQVEQFKTSDKINLYIWPTADYRVLLYNLKNPMLADPKVRTALEYALDRDAIVKSVLVGYGEAANGPLQKSDVANPDVKFGYDPAKLKQLMGEAGWTAGSDGIWQKDGKKLSLTLTAPSADPVRVDLANVAVTSLKQNGIDVKVDPQPWDFILKNWGSLDLMVLGWGSPYDPDDDTYRLFHSSRVLDKGGSNFGSYANPQVDQLLEKARTTTDAAQRKQLYMDFQKTLASDPPYLWCVYLQAIYGMSKKLSGPQQKLLGHHGSGFVWNIETWSLQ